MSSSGFWERRRPRAAAIVPALLGALVFGAVRLVGAQEGQRPSEPSGLAALLALEEVLVDTIARNERSVVSIARVKLPPDDDQLAPRGQFPNPFEFQPEEPTRFADNPSNPDFVPHEFGTGVVIDSEGLILTNAHVLGRENPLESENDELWVTTIDRQPYRVTKVVGADERIDLAVLKIEASGLTPITFGDATALRKGQIVISLGNPYAIARDGQVSAAWGMISNLARKAGPRQANSDAPAEEKPTLHHYGNLIQTDVRLNLGTSGGPLLNLKGEMIGLSTAQAALEGYEQSAGYAIPVNEVFLRAVDTLRQGQKMEYGFLGIGPSNLTSEEVLQGDLHGMRVATVLPGGPADLEGLQSMDVIQTVNGRPIHDRDSLMLEVGSLPVEAMAELTVLRPRTGAIETFQVQVGKTRPAWLQIASNPSPAWRGVRVDYATVLAEQVFQRQRLRIEHGVAVVDVESESAAWEAGLRTGMVVSAVDGRPVATPREFFEAVADRDGEVEVIVIPQMDPLEQVESPPQHFTVPAAD